MPKVKITPEIHEQIVNDLQNGMTQQSVATKYQLAQSKISLISKEIENKSKKRQRTTQSNARYLQDYIEFEQNYKWKADTFSGRRSNGIGRDKWENNNE